MRGQLDLTDMLRPAVQPGSKIDYEYPPEAVTVAFDTASPKSKLKLFNLAGRGVEGATTNTESHITLTVPSGSEKIVPVTIRLTKESGAAALTLEWTTNEDSRPRPFPLRRPLRPACSVPAAPKMSPTPPSSSPPTTPATSTVTTSSWTAAPPPASSNGVQNQWTHSGKSAALERLRIAW